MRVTRALFVFVLLAVAVCGGGSSTHHQACQNLCRCENGSSETARVHDCTAACDQERASEVVISGGYYYGRGSDACFTCIANLESCDFGQYCTRECFSSDAGIRH